MKMKIFEAWKLKFVQPDWSRYPEFTLIDTILEMNPHLIKMAAPDIMSGNKDSKYGRNDMPSVEQIVRAAIYKEMKKLDYRELEEAQSDSRICAHFLKINYEEPYSFQTLHKYISRITEETLSKLMVEINKIAIEEKMETLEKFREDSTVVETNIHYPTNNSIMYDCIKESNRLLKHLKKAVGGLKYKNYHTEGKKTKFKIDVANSNKQRKKLFDEQLKLFTNCINQVSDIIEMKLEDTGIIKVINLIMALKELLPLMKQVYKMTHDKEILGKQVPNNEKIFSIYERHTDIIVKGKRDCKFGHKIDLGIGASNLILTCHIPRGNPCDKTLFPQAIDTVMKEYGKSPVSVTTDGGYASKNNQNHAVKQGVINVVFSKITKNMKNIVESTIVEKALIRWRSGAEAVISNLKRGFNIARCTWKGWGRFQRKVLWSVIAYNIRVMTGHMLSKLIV